MAERIQGIIIMIAVTGDGAIAQRNTRPPPRGIIGIGGKGRRPARQFMGI